ncbi:hypothetical protein Ccrd_020776, partial [Cynara cardunculus var. scolymus]
LFKHLYPKGPNGRFPFTPKRFPLPGSLPQDDVLENRPSQDDDSGISPTPEMTIPFKKSFHRYPSFTAFHRSTVHRIVALHHRIIQPKSLLKAFQDCLGTLNPYHFNERLHFLLESSERFSGQLRPPRHD